MTKKREYRVAYSGGIYNPYVAQSRVKRLWGLIDFWSDVSGRWHPSIEEAEAEANAYALNYSHGSVKYLGWLPKDDYES